MGLPAAKLKFRREPDRRTKPQFGIECPGGDVEANSEFEYQFIRLADPRGVGGPITPESDFSMVRAGGKRNLREEILSQNGSAMKIICAVHLRPSGGSTTPRTRGPKNPNMFDEPLLKRSFVLGHTPRTFKLKDRFSKRTLKYV